MVSLASGAVADFDRAPATPPANRSFAVSEMSADRLSAVTMVAVLAVCLSQDADPGSARKPGAYGDIRQRVLV